MDDSTLAVLLRYESDRRHTRDRHQAVLALVMRAVTEASLYPTKAVVRQVATHWTQGAFAGALTGLGLSQTQDDDVQPAIALGAIVIGAVLGAFVRREVPVFRGAFLPATGWRLIAVEPEVSSTRFRVGFA